MSEQQQTAQNMYGYTNDEVKVIPFNFGLNAGATFLKKFEWIGNGGKEGAEQEALDIIFSVNGSDKGFRQFPVTQAFKKGTNEVTTDPTSIEFKEAVQTVNSLITHILHCFVEGENLKRALSVPINSFKQFCQIAASTLPKNFQEIPLDIFMQYQWNLADGKPMTYLELPKSMKNGKWLCPAVTPQGGEWKEVRKADPVDNDQNSLYYIDGANNKHPFTRYGKWMKSNSANQQFDPNAKQNAAAAANISAPATNAGPAPEAAGNAAPGSTANGW